MTLLKEFREVMKKRFGKSRDTKTNHKMVFDRGYQVSFASVCLRCKIDHWRQIDVKSLGSPLSIPTLSYVLVSLSRPIKPIAPY